MINFITVLHQSVQKIFYRLLKFVSFIFVLQRGSDELLSQSGAVNNGASMSPQPHHAADNNNDAKKVRVLKLKTNKDKSKFPLGRSSGNNKVIGRKR